MTHKLNVSLDGLGKASAKPYEHNLLDHNKQQIRLLRLVTKQSESGLTRFLTRHWPPSKPIVCELQTFNIDDAPEYVALSYTWGKHVPKSPIFIGEDFLEVGRNLCES